MGKYPFWPISVNETNGPTKGPKVTCNSTGQKRRTKKKQGKEERTIQGKEETKERRSGKVR